MTRFSAPNGSALARSVRADEARVGRGGVVDGGQLGGGDGLVVLHAAVEGGVEDAGEEGSLDGEGALPVLKKSSIRSTRGSKKLAPGGAGRYIRVETIVSRSRPGPGLLGSFSRTATVMSSMWPFRIRAVARRPSA